MKNIRFILTAAVVLVAISATGWTATDVSKLKFPKLNPLEIPDIDRDTLANGLRLYLVEDHSLPIFRMSVRINAGSYLEPADKVGLASILGQTLRTGGTNKWTGDELDEMLEAIGAAVETGSDIEDCNAFVNVLAEYSDLGIEVLAQILRYPVFDEDKIDLATVQERSVVSRRNDDAQTVCRREFYKQIYASAPEYARHTEYATINAVTRDDLLQFHDAYFKPENIQIAVWGDFDKAVVIAKIEEQFGDWEKGTTAVPPLPEVDYKFEQRVHYIEKTDINQSSVRFGHIGGMVTDKDYPATIVMNNVLGGGFGNRLFNRVRGKEGLAYAAYGRYNAFNGYPGAFFNYVGTKFGTTGKAVREMMKVFKSMHTEPPSPEELSRAKDGYLNSFVFNFDTKAEVVRRLMSYDHYGLPDDFLQQIKDGVEKVTADDVVAAAKKKLHPDSLLIVVVGNDDEFDVQLDELNLGPVDTIDITIPSGEEKRELAITPENLEKGTDILSKAVVAHGGLENFKKINSISCKGTMTMIMQGQEIPLQFEEIRVYPDQRYHLITFMGRQMYSIRNGNTGWKTDMASGEVVLFSEDDLVKDNENNQRSNILILKHTDNPPYRAVYDGSGKIEGTAVEYVVLIDDESETICRLAISATTFELTSKEYWGETPMGEGNIKEVFSDLKEIDGIRMPMTIIENMDGQKTASTVYSEFLVNPEVPANAFDQPE